MPNKKIWQSYVWHREQAFFVSTIERDYLLDGRNLCGIETMAWEYNYETKEIGKLLYQDGGVLNGYSEHEKTCRNLIACGKVPEDD